MFFAMCLTLLVLCCGCLNGIGNTHYFCFIKKHASSLCEIKRACGFNHRFRALLTHIYLEITPIPKYMTGILDYTLDSRKILLYPIPTDLWQVPEKV